MKEIKQKTDELYQLICSEIDKLPEEEQEKIFNMNFSFPQNNKTRILRQYYMFLVDIMYCINHMST